MANHGVISADNGWITPELTLQHRQAAVILLAYKKAQVWADFVCLDMVSLHTNISSFLAVGTNGEVEMGRDEKEASAIGDGTFCGVRKLILSVNAHRC